MIHRITLFNMSDMPLDEIYALLNSRRVLA